MSRFDPHHVTPGSSSCSKPLYRAVTTNHKHWVQEAKRVEKSGTLAVVIVEGEERDDDGV